MCQKNYYRFQAGCKRCSASANGAHTFNDLMDILDNKNGNDAVRINYPWTLWPDPRFSGLVEVCSMAQARAKEREAKLIVALNAVNAHTDNANAHILANGKADGIGWGPMGVEAVKRFYVNQAKALQLNLPYLDEAGVSCEKHNKRIQIVEGNVPCPFAVLKNDWVTDDIRNYWFPITESRKTKLFTIINLWPEGLLNKRTDLREPIVGTLDTTSSMHLDPFFLRMVQLYGFVWDEYVEPHVWLGPHTTVDMPQIMSMLQGLKKD